MIEWMGDDRLVVGGRAFDVINVRSAKDAPGATAIRKTRWMVERYIELVEVLAPRRVVELGIDRGGSTVFLATLMGQLEHLLAVDIGEVPAGLVDFVERDDWADRVHCHGGVDQADRELLLSLVEEVFGDQTLDLVVDDASHLLAQTRASFDALFPRLAPGGVFVVEDWSWDHTVARVIADRMEAGDIAPPADPDAALARDMPLSRLVLECVLTSGYAPEVISEVRVRRGWTEIVRGPADLSGPDFRVADHLGWLSSRVLEQAFAEPSV